VFQCGFWILFVLYYYYYFNLIVYFFLIQSFHFALINDWIWLVFFFFPGFYGLKKISQRWFDFAKKNLVWLFANK
jgi:hypothetical protein